MNLHRIQLLLWAEQGYLDVARLPDALRLVRAFPASEDWRQFADRLLLALAVLALTSGVIFFFAYNWELLGHFSRFALAEGALALALLGVWHQGLARIGGQASLFAAALCLGALLALLGQTYQTGADVWELFAFWGLLLLPWALLGQQALLWFFWLALINVALGLYLADMPDGRFPSLENWQTFLLLDLPALSLWEGAARRLSELNRRWALRLVALGVTACVTYGGIGDILELRVNSVIAWGLWAAGFWYVYRHHVRDFFMLVLVAASFILLVVAALARALLATSYAVEYKILLAGIFVVGLTLGMGVCLWRIYKNMAAETGEKSAGETA
jgi:uncharacterized membrane protein